MTEYPHWALCRTREQLVLAESLVRMLVKIGINKQARICAGVLNNAFTYDGDWLTMSDPADWHIPTGDFTVER